MLHEAADTGKTDHLSDEQLEAVTKCLDFVAFVADQILGGGCEEWIEKRVAIDEDGITIPFPLEGEDPRMPTTAGFADRVLIAADRKTAAVIDFKFGIHPVEPAENNLQGLAYALGVLRELPTIEKIHVFFVCPFMEDEDGEDGLIEHAEFDREALEKARLRIKVVVERAIEADKAYAQWEKETTIAGKIQALDKIDFNPTDGCLFCARAGKCPAVGALALKASSKYEALQLPDVLNPAMISDPADAAKALKFFSIMEGVAKAFRQACTEKALNSEEDWVPEGYQLSTVVRRKVADNVAFYKTIRPLLTEEEILQCIDFTLGPVEKLVSAKAPRGSKKKAVQELKDVLQACGATEESEPIGVLRVKRKKKADVIELDS